jgi:hypothetical protein
MWKNNELDFPVCELFCDMCDGCSARRPHLNYYLKDESTYYAPGELGKFTAFDNYKKEKNGK